MTIISPAVPGSDGLVNIGTISSNVDVKNISVDGGLEGIYVGNRILSTPGLGSLTVKAFGAMGGALDSEVWGAVGKVVIENDFASGTFNARGGNFGNIGLVDMGETMTGSAVLAEGRIDKFEAHGIADGNVTAGL